MIFEYNTLDQEALLDPPRVLGDLGIALDNEATENSMNPITSGAVYEATKSGG